jgi:hypothetical protein
LASSMPWFANRLGWIESLDVHVNVSLFVVFVTAMFR